MQLTVMLKLVKTWESKSKLRIIQESQLEIASLYTK